MSYRRVHRKKNTPLTWHTWFTTGKPLMLSRIAVTATTGTDDVILEVPQGERWILIKGHFINCTLSSGDNNCSIALLGQDNGLLGYLEYDATCASGQMINFPSTTAQDDAFVAVCPTTLYEGQKVKFSCGADANKSGSFKYYLDALQFEVGDDTS